MRTITSTILLAWVLCLAPFALAQSNVTDMEALLEFKAALTESSALSNWDPKTSICSWTGVSCGYKSSGVQGL